MPSSREPPRPRRGGPGILTNSVINVGAQVAVAGMGALGGLITANVLGPAGVGVLAVAFILSDFGRALSSCTHVPSILEYHKGEPLERVFGTSLVIKVCLGLVFAGFLYLASPFLMGVFQVPQAALVLASLVILLGSFFEVGAARLEADNRFLRNAFILASGSVVGLLAVLALWATGRLTVMTSIATTILANLVMSLGALAFAYRPRDIRFDLRLAKDMIRYGGQLVVVQLLAQALLQTDTLMVSNLLGNAQAGIYNVVFQLTFLMVTASTAMGVALVPALSDLVGRGEDTTEGYQRGTLISLVFSSLLSAFYALGGFWILGLYGSAFQAGLPALLVLILFGVSAALAVPASSMLTVHGHARWLVGLGVLQLLANLVLNYVLIRTFGLTGAALATTLVFVAGTMATWWMVHRQTGAVPLSWRVIREGAHRLRAWVGRRRA